ncbi:MAG: Gldg family protein, partial [Bacillota bacterium]
MKVRLPISLGAKASSPLAPQPSKRKWLFGANAVILTIAVIAIVVLVNIILHQHPYRIDVTRTKEYSLSEQTKSILANLDQEVKLTAFLISGESRLTQDLIEEYRLASPKVQVEIVDPIANPDKAR